MSGYKKFFGYIGEKLVCEYLEKKGYKVLKRNFRIWGGEIDIIAEDLSSDEIVFIEVKTRTDEKWMCLDETLSERQVNFIKRAGRRFLFYSRLEERNWRIDHIAILINHGKIIKLEHLQNVGY